MSEKTDKEFFMDTVKLPVYWNENEGMIYDSNNNPVAVIPEWGRIQYLSNRKKRRASIGKYICSIINEKDGSI